jgi:tRNA pseudouridine55 synthase
MPTGALLVDKPEGLTSHDVVDRVRRLSGERRCGHTGTLDPFATGLLVLCLGRATRLSRFVSGMTKTYVATVRFGFATDTYDRTGKPVGEPRGDGPGREELLPVLAAFLGAQLQLPPPFSAKKIDGRRAYRLARAGLSVQPAAVEIRIDRIALVDHTPPLARLEVTVSSGTYIRSLAHDLGRKLGCGAHLAALRRTRVGSFRVEDASTLEALETAASDGRLGHRLLAPAQLVAELPPATLDADEAVRFVHGRRVHRPEVPDEAVRVLGPSGELLGVARGAPSGDGGLLPLVVWARPEEGEAHGA